MKLSLTLDNLKWLLMSLVFTSLAIWFSYNIFPSQSSILAISFVTIALTPPLYRLMDNEERIASHSLKRPFLKKYGGVIENVLLMAAGIFIAFSLWYSLLPAEMNDAVFSLQNEAMLVRSLDSLLGLMLFSFLLSLFVGSGAILIITWDLSVLVVSSSLGAVSLLIYMPQMLAFFLTGLAGALLSFAVIHHEWKSRGFYAVLRDSFALMGLSVALIFVSYFLSPFLNL